MSLYFFLLPCSGYPLHKENRENCPKEITVRENTGNFEILQKHRIWFAQVVISLILKVKDILIFVAKVPNIF